MVVLNKTVAMLRIFADSIQVKKYKKKVKNEGPQKNNLTFSLTVFVF